jgi:hypothetical protein
MMADLTPARRALIDTEEDETPYLYMNVPRRALMDPATQIASSLEYIQDAYGRPPSVPMPAELRSNPRSVEYRAPVSPKWKFVWIIEGAVILLLVSVIVGGMVVPWLIG